MNVADMLDHIADCAAAGDLGEFERLICTAGWCNEVANELRAEADRIPALEAEVARLRDAIVDIADDCTDADWDRVAYRKAFALVPGLLDDEPAQEVQSGETE